MDGDLKAYWTQIAETLGVVEKELEKVKEDHKKYVDLKRSPYPWELKPGDLVYVSIKNFKHLMERKLGGGST